MAPWSPNAHNEQPRRRQFQTLGALPCHVERFSQRFKPDTTDFLSSFPGLQTPLILEEQNTLPT